MRSLGRRRPVGRPDPAPSRLAYRLNRLALTPSVRRLFVFGLPLFAGAVIVALTFADPDRRAAVATWVIDTKAQFQHREEFLVKSLHVKGASAEIAADIRARLPLDLPISSFDLDLLDMREKVLSLDAVARADLRVRPGGELQVLVTERTPAVVWRHQGGLDLLDASGHRVRPVERRSARPSLPLVAGPGAEAAVPEALDLIAVAAPIGARLRGLERIGQRRWDLVLDRGQRLMLPQSEAAFALEQILALHEAQDLLARDVTHVDMRDPHRPTVRLARDTAASLRRIKLLELGDD